VGTVIKKRLALRLQLVAMMPKLVYLTWLDDATRLRVITRRIEMVHMKLTQLKIEEGATWLRNEGL
jgi:hypothetical protein